MASNEQYLHILLAILDNDYKIIWREWYIWTQNFSWGGENFLLSDNKLIKFVKVLKSKWGSKTQMVPLNKNEIYHQVSYNHFPEIIKQVSSSHPHHPPYWKRTKKSVLANLTENIERFQKCKWVNREQRAFWDLYLYIMFTL